MNEGPAIPNQARNGTRMTLIGPDQSGFFCLYPPRSAQSAQSAQSAFYCPSDLELLMKGHSLTHYSPLYDTIGNWLETGMNESTAKRANSPWSSGGRRELQERKSVEICKICGWMSFSQ
jgi:hypothetical protein